MQTLHFLYVVDSRCKNFSFRQAPADPYYRHVKARKDEIAEAAILTTGGVLSEFLTFFAADQRLRDRAGRTVQALLEVSGVRVVPETRQPFCPAWSFTAKPKPTNKPGLY